MVAESLSRSNGTFENETEWSCTKNPQSVVPETTGELFVERLSNLSQRG